MQVAKASPLERLFVFTYPQKKKKGCGEGERLALIFSINAAKLSSFTLFLGSVSVSHPFLVSLPLYFRRGSSDG
jgi:hypothetical protein